MATVVDPIENIDLYIQVAESAGMRIAYVIDTHGHADHLSGGLKLAKRAGVEYVLHESTEAKFCFNAVKDGDVLDLGNVRAKILHTPGHTPEHISVLVTDHSRSNEPWFICTGHTLMIGDMGRTELANSLEDGARQLFQSASKLKALADYIQVFPGAFSGSVCGRGLSANPISTIGFERRFNKTFAVEDEAEFVRLMSENIPPRPPNAIETRKANLGWA